MNHYLPRVLRYATSLSDAGWGLFAISSTAADAVSAVLLFSATGAPAKSNAVKDIPVPKINAFCLVIFRNPRSDESNLQPVQTYTVRKAIN